MLGEELLYRDDLHGDILQEVSKLVTADGLKIADALIRAQVSLDSPDLIYVSDGVARRKRAQEHVFILSPGGGIGIDTSYGVMKPIFTKTLSLTHLTQGSLTSRENVTEQNLDHSLVFLREFYASNTALVNDVKSIIEERELCAYRSYDQGAKSELTPVKVSPCFFVGCNSLSKALDTAFYSRFDHLYCLNPDKPALLDIKDKQISTLPTSGEIEKWLQDNENRVSALAEYRNAFERLADTCTDDYFIVVDNVRDIFDEGVSKILDNSDERIRSRYPRDVEVGFRAMHNNAWLKQFLREQKNSNGLHYIFCNEEDARLGIAHAERSFQMKQQFLEIRDNYERGDKRTKQKEHEFYLKNYDVLDKMSYRDQATWLRNAGYIVSAKQLSLWNKKQKSIEGGA